MVHLTSGFTRPEHIHWASIAPRSLVCEYKLMVGLIMSTGKVPILAISGRNVTNSKRLPPDQEPFSPFALECSVVDPVAICEDVLRRWLWVQCTFSEQASRSKNERSGMEVAHWVFVVNHSEPFFACCSQVGVLLVAKIRCRRVSKRLQMSHDGGKPL